MGENDLKFDAQRNGNFVRLLLLRVLLFLPLLVSSLWWLFLFTSLLLREFGSEKGPSTKSILCCQKRLLQLNKNGSHGRDFVVD